MGFLRDILYGAIIGVANVIPGVSGGTMAVILNIYDKLISAISLKNLKKNLRFLIPLVLGAGLGILLFSKAVKFLYETYPMATNFTFMGLILGSIPMIYRRARSEKLRSVNLIAFFLAFLLMLVLYFANQGEIQNAVMTVLDAKTALILFSASVISAFAMILPGISGSFIMLILGAYTTVITAISDLNIVLLIPVAIGCAIGILLGAKIVKVLLTHFPQATYLAILGLVVGSLFHIYPGFSFNAEGIIAVILMVTASAAAYWFSVSSSEEPEIKK